MQTQQFKQVTQGLKKYKLIKVNKLYQNLFKNQKIYQMIYLGDKKQSTQMFSNYEIKKESNYNILMIADIIKQVYRGESQSTIKELLDVPIICGCLFRSFDQFTQHIILQMFANQGSITKKQILSKMQRSPHYAEGEAQFTTAMANLVSIKVVNRAHMDSLKYTLNEYFQKRLNEYIMTIPKQFGQSHDFRKDGLFNLLSLLRQDNEILRECKIGNMRQHQNMTKENFEFIRRPIGYKISILIKGYLKLITNKSKRKTILLNILTLSTMNNNNKYKITAENTDLLNQLQKIHLVLKVDQNYFIISPFLHNFPFEEKKNVKLLNCSIIIQTNFKVYVQIEKSNSRLNYQLIRDIMRNLIKIDYASHDFEELIVGEIEKQKMMQIFYTQKISVQDYLSFFLEYMSADLNIQKDLGKWNKIKFLGLQGPQGQMMIPNNVRQELKLWQSMARNGTRGNFNFEGMNEAEQQYGY